MSWSKVGSHSRVCLDLETEALIVANDLGEQIEEWLSLAPPNGSEDPLQ